MENCVFYLPIFLIYLLITKYYYVIIKLFHQVVLMYLYEKLNLNIKTGEIISLVGGGGKTTTLYMLANELKNKNKKVLVTTTTAIYSPERGYDYYFLGLLHDYFIPREGSWHSKAFLLRFTKPRTGS